MNVRELVKKNRTYRRFDESKPISMAQLERWVDTARLTPNGTNKQPFKYALIADSKVSLEIFGTLKWAGYLSDWDGPGSGERPTGYIIVLHDKSILPALMGDQGIPVQTILLSAVEEGYGGCILAAIDRKKIAEILTLPENLEVLWVIALGVPKEEVQIVQVPESGDIRYYRDENQVHYVPKRSLEELVVVKK